MRAPVDGAISPAPPGTARFARIAMASATPSSMSVIWTVCAAKIPIAVSLTASAFTDKPIDP